MPALFNLGGWGDLDIDFYSHFIHLSVPKCSDFQIYPLWIQASHPSSPLGQDQFALEVFSDHYDRSTSPGHSHIFSTDPPTDIVPIFGVIGGYGLLDPAPFRE